MERYKRLFVESEKYYYNYRRNKSELNEEIIFCVDNPNRSRHYGNIQRIFKATHKTDKDHRDIIKYAEDFYSIDKYEAEKIINPKDITTSAGAWDDIDFINYLYDDTKYFNKYDGIITHDGAVFFEINKNNLVATNYLEKQEKQWITIKLSEINHVKEIQAITYIYNHLKKQNNPQLKNKKESDTKIVIQRIIGLLSSGKSIDHIAAIIHESKFFVQLIKTIYEQEYGLKESLTINDLKKHSGISDFTYKFMKDRQKKKGAGNISAKLVKAKINIDSDYITLIFLSEPTNTFDTKVTKPPTMELVSDNLYTQEIKYDKFFSLLKTDPNFKDLKSVSIDDIKKVLKSGDIKVWCDDPSFYWMGMDYNISQLDAAIYPTDIPPKHWDKYHGGNQLVCKHLSLILQSIEFYVPIAAGMIYKYLQNK